MFRVPFLMERMAPGSVGAAFNSAYLANYTQSINYITQKGGWAVVDPHNFGRYGGNIITDVSAFGSFWTKLAAAFKDNAKVVCSLKTLCCVNTDSQQVFDTNNEYHDMDQKLVFDLNQVSINSIRAAGATSRKS